MNHQLVKELITNAQLDEKVIVIRAARGAYRIHPDTPVTYYLGAIHFENIYVTIEHIISIKTIPMEEN